MQKETKDYTVQSLLKLQDVEIESFGALNYVASVAKALAKKMLSGQVKEYVIFHDTDMDGVVGGTLLHRIFQVFLAAAKVQPLTMTETLQVYPLTSGIAFEEGIAQYMKTKQADVERVIVIVDHAWRPEAFQALQAYGTIFLIDHHLPTKALDTAVNPSKLHPMVTTTSCSTMKAYQLSIALIDQLTDADYSQFSGYEAWDRQLSDQLDAVRELYTSVEYCVLVALTDYEDRYQYKGLNTLQGEERQTEYAARSLSAWFQSNVQSADRIRQLILEDMPLRVDGKLPPQQDIFHWIMEGESLFQMKEEMVKLVMKRYGKPVIWNYPVNQEYVGFRVMVYLHADLINRLSEKTLEEHPEIDAVAVFRISSGRVKCSIRSRATSQLNVRQLAEYFGGGGHLTASGFTVGLPAFAKLLQDSVNIDTV